MIRVKSVKQVMGSVWTMKKYSILFLLLIMGFLVSGQEVSAAKRLERVKTHKLYIEQGKTYKLSKILSDIKDPLEGDTLKDCLKGKKVKWSAKKSQIKLTKKTIKGKKQGEFQLTGVTKKYKYVITLVSVARKWPEVPEEITSVSIMRRGRTVVIRDMNEVRYFCNLLNSADYCFDYKCTNNRFIGWEYRICLYTEEGVLERSFTGNIIDHYWYKPENPVDVCQYIEAQYEKLLVEQDPPMEW